MNSIDEAQIQSTWKSQPVQRVAITPAQMQQRAAGFEDEAGRRNRIDLWSFGLLVLIGIGGVMAMDTMLLRAGIALLALWALVGMYGVRRFHRLSAPGSAESLGVTGATWYRQQLERQRDVALSRPWGIALAVPGVCLLLMGYVDAGAPPDVVVILGALMVFAGVAVVIHGRILAGRWQREISLVESAERDWKGAA